MQIVESNPKVSRIIPVYNGSIYLEVGSNMLSGAEPESILACVRTVLGSPRNWLPPAEYLANDVSRTALKLVLGHW